jgi:hypothetical protein
MAYLPMSTFLHLLLSRYHSEVIEDKGFYVGGAAALWD